VDVAAYPQEIKRLEAFLNEAVGDLPPLRRIFYARSSNRCYTTAGGLLCLCSSTKNLLCRLPYAVEPAALIAQPAEALATMEEQIRSVYSQVPSMNAFIVAQLAPVMKKLDCVGYQYTLSFHVVQ
jgi:hypothetical protein